ncbi:MAG: hypothetical protein GX288_12095 [Clostridiales bacterium]|nr:hypothetical protein [Clostridiales bacterium]
MNKGQKRRLLLLMEIRWRLVIYKKRKIYRMINNGITLSSEKMVKEYRRLENLMLSIMEQKIDFEYATGEKIIFYGIRNIVAQI